MINKIEGKMFSFLKKSKPAADENVQICAKDSAYNLYLKAVEMSREARLYNEYGVADTTDGRFDLLALHVSLFLDRLEYYESNVEHASQIGQELFDVFFQDMDQSLREKGIGDTGVPKHMRRMLEGFNGRHSRYRIILSEYHKGLTEQASKNMRHALVKNIYNETDNEHVDQLLGYIENLIIGLKAVETNLFIHATFDGADVTKGA